MGDESAIYHACIHMLTRLTVLQWEVDAKEQLYKEPGHNLK